MRQTIDAGDDERVAGGQEVEQDLQFGAPVAPRAFSARITSQPAALSLAKRAKRNLAFSAEGTTEIRQMLRRLATNARTAAAVFMTGDVRAARELLGEKEGFRDLETRATEAHFARIRAGRVESVETSALHLDLLRDLKRINAHLAAATYPVLEQRGELLSSRLKQET